MVQLINPASVTTGDLNVNQDPATANTLQTQSGQVAVNTSFTVAAGAYAVLVQNTGLNSITVNGQTLDPGAPPYEIEAKLNPTNNRYDFCPAVVIVTPNDPNGSTAFYVATRPSA